jgi:tetratricopeptide (TPR) repeat protein
MEMFATCWAGLVSLDLGICRPVGLSLNDWAGILGFLVSLFAPIGAVGYGSYRVLRRVAHRAAPPRHDDAALIAQPEIVGRRPYFRRIDEAVRGRGGWPAVAIAGPGGYGKTTLAAAYAKARRGRYRGVWRVPADDLSRARNALEPLGKSLGLAEVPEKAEPGVRAVLYAMAAAGGPWLLIHDNLDDASRLDDLRRRLLHPDRIDHLITGRLTDWGRTALPVSLDLLDPDEAGALLSIEANRPRDDALERIATDTLGRHPLAIVIAGQILRRTDLSVDTLAGRFAERLADAPEGRDYAKSLWAVVEESADRLGPVAGALLDLAAVMAPEDVHPGYLAAGAEAIAKRGWEPLPEPLAGLAADELRRAEAFAELRGQSLVTEGAWEGPGGREEPTNLIHRLTQLVLRDRMGEAALARHVGLAARLGTAQFSDRVQFDIDSWPRYHRLAPQALALAPLAGLAAAPDRARAAGFVHQAALFLWHATGDLSTVRRLCENNLEAMAAAFGEGSDEYAAALGNLATALDLLGEDAAAEARYREAIAVREAATEEGDPRRAYEHNNLGGFYRRRGRFGEAETELKWAYRIRTTAEGVAPELIASSTGNLGTLYSDWADATGDAEKRRLAMDYKTRALGLTRAALGPAHPGTATAHHNLAAEHHLAGDAPAAAAQQLRAAAIMLALARAGAIPETHPNREVSRDPLEPLFRAAGRDPAEIGAALEAEVEALMEEQRAWDKAERGGDPPG